MTESSAPAMAGVLRTPDERFAALPGYAWAAHYTSDLPGVAGIRVGCSGTSLDLVLVELGGIEPPSESLCRADLRA